LEVSLIDTEVSRENLIGFRTNCQVGAKRVIHAPASHSGQRSVVAELAASLRKFEMLHPANKMNPGHQTCVIAEDHTGPATGKNRLGVRTGGHNGSAGIPKSETPLAVYTKPRCEIPRYTYAETISGERSASHVDSIKLVA
jgi:hypothetical protein